MLKGYQFSGISAGIKKNGHKDLGLIISEKPAAAAAVFTQNIVKAAPVLIGMDRITEGMCQAVVVNSGNANCCTGDRGMKDAIDMTDHVSEKLGLDKSLVIPSSTGVIGEYLPMDVISKAVPELVASLTVEDNGLNDFSESILTTDTQSKVVTEKGTENGKEYRITGVAKGSGMIRPDMATMLCYILTDADVSADTLREMLRKSVERSFNRITVDGDTSTNDTVILMSNGCSGAHIRTEKQVSSFQEKLDRVTLELSRKIVADGEGVTKFVEISVKGASSVGDAKKAAMTIAESSLVKTALFGEDPNWGRIIAAAGRSGITFDPDKTNIWFNDVMMVKAGCGCGKKTEEEAAMVMKQKAFSIIMELNNGESDYSVFTCDFSYDYIKINADYRS